MARKALDVLGMSEEEQAKLTEEEITFYSDSVKLAAEQAMVDDPEFQAILRKRAEAVINAAKEGPKGAGTKPETTSGS